MPDAETRTNGNAARDVSGDDQSTSDDADDQSPLLRVIREASTCTTCPAMHGRPRVLGQDNGSATARCLVIAEAPGHLGAGKTGIPLHGDRTGDNFERLLREADLSRDELFITNAVLCSPKTAAGTGRKPTKTEVQSCRRHLRALVDALDPAIVVTLGATALDATEGIDAHGLTLKWDVGDVRRWYGRFLLPLYHPGARSTIQRPWADQRRDFALLASLLHA